MIPGIAGIESHCRHVVEYFGDCIQSENPILESSAEHVDIVAVRYRAKVVVGVRHGPRFLGLGLKSGNR